MSISQTEIDDAVEMFSGALFSALGPIRTRKMMGGLTLYAHDLTFAIYDPDQGYFLKVDETNREDYLTEGLEPFQFEFKNGKSGTMNYYPMPERCYDDPEERSVWARKAVDVALRAHAKKSKKT